MGNLIVFKSTLREEMQPYSALTLSAVRKLIRRFDSLQESFGWGIGYETFIQLFKLKKSDPAAKELWKCWDTDGNGVTDVLEILAGLTLISIGTFEEKLETCFNLFDFDENHVLTADEMNICVKTAICGLCKLLDMIEPSKEDIEKLSAKAFNVVGTGARSITKDEFLKYVVCTPTIIQTICRFGTSNSEATKRKYAEMMSEDKAALKIQAAFKSSKIAPNSKTSPTSSSTPTQVQAKIDSHRRRDDPNYARFDYNIHAIRRAKFIFDQIDQDKSGAISIHELAASMSGQEFAGAAVAAFQAMDTDGSGTLTFDEMLKTLYPYARPHDIKMMLRDTDGVAVDKESVQALQIWFESHDDDFDGRIILKDIIAGLQADNVFKKFLDGYTLNAKLADKPVGFTTLLSELFATSHKGKFQQILSWSKLNGPIHQLDAKQQAELETLFSLYDKDGSGSITMTELKQHFKSMGFSEDEMNRLFMKYDRDGNQKVDLLEFKKFYRSVWDVTTKMASPLAKHPSTNQKSMTLTSHPSSSQAADMESEYR